MVPRIFAAEVDELGEQLGFCGVFFPAELFVAAELLVDEITSDIGEAEYVLFEGNGFEEELLFSEVDGTDVIEVLVHDGQFVVEGVGADLFELVEGKITDQIAILNDQLELGGHVLGYFFKNLCLGVCGRRGEQKQRQRTEKRSER